MRSSSTEPAASVRPGGRRGFWPGDPGAWTRLALVVVLGGAALVTPAIGATTGALYTDSETVGFDVVPSAPPTTPAAETTTDPASVESALQAPAALTAQAPAALPAETSPASPAPGEPPTTSSGSDPAATPTATPAPGGTPTPTPTGQGRQHAPWPVWPHKGR